MTRLEQVQGIWTVMASTMGNKTERTRTELAVTEARYNTGLGERDFSRASWRTVPGANVEPGARPLPLPLPASPLTFLIVAGALLLAPRAQITRIDNDISAWFSKDDPVLRDYDRLRQEFTGSRTLSSPSPASVAAAAGLDVLRRITSDIEHVPLRRAGLQPGQRQLDPADRRRRRRHRGAAADPARQHHRRSDRGDPALADPSCAAT